MGLSKDLIQQFVEVTNDLQNQNEESFVLGTVHNEGENYYVKIDGSDSYTPVYSTTKMNEGDRVTVMIKNHTATVTGNITSPSLDGNAVDGKIGAFSDIVTESITAINGNIDNLVSENVSIKNKLTANEAEIETLKAYDVTVEGKLTANEAEINELKTKKLDVETANITFATIENLDATNANINNLTANFGTFSNLTTENFTAINAEIDDLYAKKLDAETAQITYATIDFANINEAAVEKIFSESGIIGDLVVDNGNITGTLVGVTIKGDLIEGGTVVADKLVVKGSDGLYYKLNTDGVTTETEQTEYNSLNGSVITAKSITATKISVEDLVAFGATIGGFKITDDSIYSGVKSNITNTTPGIYLDKTGQTYIGDADNYLKFVKEGDSYKLSISAESIYLGTTQKSVSESIEALENQTVGGLDTVYAHVEDQITEVRKDMTSSIEVLTNSVNSNVSEITTIKAGMTTMEQTLSSNINQTASSITASVTSQIKTVSDNLESFESTVTSYMEFTDSGLELGKSNSKFKTVLTNEKLSFQQDGTDVAYISNKEMNITDASVTNQLKIGKFAFVPRSNGNTSIKWIG